VLKIGKISFGEKLPNTRVQPTGFASLRSARQRTALSIPNPCNRRVKRRVPKIGLRPVVHWIGSNDPISHLPSREPREILLNQDV